MSTKLEVYTMAAQILNELGYESSVREEYSGRGMYGRHTPAIVSDASGPMVGAAVVQAAVEVDPDCGMYDSMDYVPSCQDNMGLSQVYY